MKKTPILCLFALLMLFASCKKEAPELKKTTETAQSVRPPIIKAVTDLEVGEDYIDVVDYTENEHAYWPENGVFALIVDWDIRYPHLEQANFPSLYHIQIGVSQGNGGVFYSSFPNAYPYWSYEHQDGYVMAYTVTSHGNLVSTADNKTYFVTTYTTYRDPYIFIKSIIRFTRLS